MNTQIQRILMHRLSSTAPREELECEAREIISTHNDAARYGLIENPQLIFGGVDYDEDNNDVMVTVQPRSGMLNIHDLYNLKELWGADDLNVHKDGIELVFKK